jgi:hypothetical protein
MDKSKMLETFELVLKKSDEIQGMVSIDMLKNSTEGWHLTFRVWPDSKAVEHATITKCASLKKLERDEDLGWFRADSDGFAVDVVVDKPCKIVGYRTEKKAVVKTIETGDFTEIRVPVTDCEIKKGTVKIGEYEAVA